MSEHNDFNKRSESWDSSEEDDSDNLLSATMKSDKDNEVDAEDKKPEADAVSSGFKRPRRVMTREEILAKARTRSRIRRQKNKEYYDEMQREVFTLIQSNAHLRKQNTKLEAIIKSAREKILLREMKTWEEVQQLQAMSSMKAHSSTQQSREQTRDYRSQESSSLLQIFMDQHNHRLALGSQTPRMNEALLQEFFRRHQSQALEPRIPGGSDFTHGSTVQHKGTQESLLHLLTRKVIEERVLKAGTTNVTPGEVSRRRPFDQNLGTKYDGPKVNNLDYDQLISNILGRCQGKISPSTSSSFASIPQNPRQNATPFVHQQLTKENPISNSRSTVSNNSLILGQHRLPQSTSYDDISRRSFGRQFSSPPNSLIPSNDALDRISIALRQLRQMDGDTSNNLIPFIGNNSFSEQAVPSSSRTGQRQQLQQHNAFSVPRARSEEMVGQAESSRESNSCGAIPNNEDEKSLDDTDPSQLLARFLSPNRIKEQDKDGKPSGNSSRAA